MLIFGSKILSKTLPRIRFYKSQLKNIQSLTDPVLIEKAEKIKQSKPDYDKLLDFDPQMLSQVPWIFKPIQPFIDSAKDFLMAVNENIGLPWPAVIMMSCVFIRLTILPLMYVQIKRVSKIAPLSPVFIHLKDAFKSSNQKFVKKCYLSIQAFRSILIDQNLHFMRTFIYNIIHFPIILTMIYTIRKLIAEPEVGACSFLHLSNLTASDPYLILPMLTIVMHYYNFQRFITKQNAHTIMSKVRSVCQVLLLLWFPWLCSWPSGIVLYMATNAFLSTIQISFMMHPKINQKMNPKMVHYGYLLNKVEYDLKSSSALTEAIKTGNQNLKAYSITEQKIQQKAKELIKHMNQSLKNTNNIKSTNKKQKQYEQQSNNDNPQKNNLKKEQMKNNNQ